MAMRILDKIEKPTVIVTSLGRTGTKFFQVVLNNFYPDIASFHEPDVVNFFQYQGWSTRITELIRQGKESSFWDLFIKKSVGKWSMIDLSDRRYKGTIGEDDTVERMIKYRKSFISRQLGTAYLESNIGYYGVLDLLERVFTNYRALYVVRDGREWVRSHMNWGQMYGKGYIQSLFAHQWPTAAEIGDMSNSDWQQLSRFEKLCWAWNNLNRYALDSAAGNFKVMVLRFEDIFISSGKYKYLDAVIQHIYPICGTPGIVDFEQENILGNKVHAGSGDFPGWKEWSDYQRKIFAKHSGDLSRQLGYEDDVN